MNVSLLAVGTRMPGWVQEGVEEYARRMRQELRFELREVPLPRRGKSKALEQLLRQEGESLLARVNPGDHLVALEVTGRVLSTADLAGRLQSLQQEGRNLSLMIGGPDGLSRECLNQADEQWSLSALTLPHPLVRVLLTEQLYRAWSLLKGHPYHRE